MHIADSCGAALLDLGQTTCFASEIESRFGERLLRLAKTKLDRRLAARIDEHDVLQSVMRSFFNRHAQGQFGFDSWDEVWGLLVLMTKRKCVKQGKVHFAECRDVRRDSALGNLRVGNSGLESESMPYTLWEPAVCLGSTPPAVVLLAEASERLFENLTDREQDVLALALAGRTVEQIGDELGRTQRTVRRLLGRVRERLECMASEVA